MKSHHPPSTLPSYSQLVLYLGLTKIGTISMVFKDLSRNLVFFRTELKHLYTLLQSSHLCDNHHYHRHYHHHHHHRHLLLLLLTPKPKHYSSLRCRSPSALLPQKKTSKSCIYHQHWWGGGGVILLLGLPFGSKKD